ncbi:MAG: hypothetical protein GF330_11685 [Candidatus Eisenbacteria bacterium]|nr:hypothetical protein [Candidatus Eisenbacteria bacterium]
MRSFARILALGAGALIVLGLYGCPFMPDQDDGGGNGGVVITFEPRTSPENLCENLMSAYKERSIVEYESLLAEDFTFYFSEEDQSRPEIPEQWGRNEEIEAHEGMFDGEYVQTLSLDFVYDDPVFDEEHFDGVDSLWKVEVTNMDLELFGTPRSHPGEAPQLYKVEDGQVTFRFRKMHYAHSNGDPIWMIAEMEETTTSSP